MTTTDANDGAQPTFGVRDRRSRKAIPALVVSLLVVLAVTFLTPASGSSAADGRYVDRSFFGLHAGYAPGSLLQPPWAPTAARLHSVGTPWCRLNPAPGVFNWAPLDAWFAQAGAQGADLLYTFSRVPLWASTASNSTTEGCGDDNDLRMSAPPDDAAWQDFVTALVQHAAGRIKAYELWNEPDGWYFTGSVDQMVKMSDLAARAIRANDPNAKIVGPSVTRGGAPWLQQYLAKVPRADIDIVAFHGYPAPAEGPEGIITLTGRIRSAMAATGYAGYPLWNTEGSWGMDKAYNAYSDPKWQRAFVGRLETLNASLGIERFYWYRYDAVPGQGWGTLWSAQTGLTPAGVAMGQIVDWLAGATLTAPCAKSLTGLWTCDITRSGGYTGRIVWAQTGSQPYVVPAQSKTMRTLDGGTQPTSAVITVGIEPVLLEPGAAAAPALPTGTTTKATTFAKPTTKLATR